MTLLGPPPGKKKSGSKYGPTAIYVAVPGILVVSPLVGFFAGQWLDGKFGTDPYLMALGLFLGFAAAGKEIYNLIRKAQAMEEDEDKEDNR